MRPEEMKACIPDTPVFIHDRISQEVERQTGHKVHVSPLSAAARMCAGQRWKMPAAAAAAACILVLPMIAYASGKLYEWLPKRVGTYGVETMIGTEREIGEEGAASDRAGDLTLPAEVCGIRVNAGYMPDQMEWVDDAHTKMHGADGSGISFMDELLDTNDLGKAIQDVNVIDYQKQTFGSHDGIYLSYHDLKQDGSYNQRIYLLYPEVWRVIVVFANDFVAKDDLIKVAENLKVEDTGKMMATAGMDTWSQKPSDAGREMLRVSASADQLNVRRIGDTIQSDVYADAEGERERGEGEPKPMYPISIRVDSVRVCDRLQDINVERDLLPEKWQKAIDENGMLRDNHLSYIKKGDGINELSRVVKEEDVKQKFVTANVTYTNRSDMTLMHVHYLGVLMHMAYESGMYHLYDPLVPRDGSADMIMTDADVSAGSDFYCDVRDTQGSGNYIPVLRAGESRQLQMTWIVQETELENLYLDLSGYDQSISFAEDIGDACIVDIRQ